MRQRRPDQLCIRDLAASEKNGRLDYHPDLNPLLPPPKQQWLVESGGLAPLYGLSRTTKQSRWASYGPVRGRSAMIVPTAARIERLLVCRSSC
jgi:hypothetical protein